MSGRRRTRTRQGQRRLGQPRTLRARLVVASLVLVAVVAAVIGTVTTLALRTHLYAQLDEKLTEAVGQAAGTGGPPGGRPDRSDAAPKRILPREIGDFVTYGPVPVGTIIAEVHEGAITAARIGEKDPDNADYSGRVAGNLTESETEALNRVSRDDDKHTVDLGARGVYRVAYETGRNGSYYVALPTEEANSTLNTLVLIEASVTAAALVAAGIASSVLVGVATRPLRKVAATATRVSELPLHTGEVNLDERVPESETDPHTEVGQVGAALNRMLDHVHAALHSRQQSETRVRQFVADASHELRTPLASIRGYAELTRRGSEQVGPDTRHALGRIESEAGRMTLLVEDLLLLARLDAGRPLQFEPTDLVPLVVDTISDARAAGMDHNWRLDLPEEPALVSADAARLQQVLVNLLGNARTHTPPGTTVTARVRRRGTWLCVDVADNGPGISPDLLPRVFERFARGDSSRSRASGSTGLGLAIVQAVATAHGGAVTVDSVPGRTVFTVRLPALPLPPSPETSRRQHSQAQHSVTTWAEQGA
ncbi:HAMP domain-containing sensor histidine kinase [Streptomyces sp. NPDC006385]|uniref:sensor histidine kinase n=1 Tax=Streptomyces sp. NPDC006385 TaxID=3156761 RepID=UPI0033B14BDC